MTILYGRKKSRHDPRRLLPVLITGFFLLTSAIPVLAIEYGGFGGRPAYPRSDNPRTESIFVHTVEPGSLQDDGVLVLNNTAETKTLLVYAADSTPSTGGAFGCKQFSEQKTGVGDWIILGRAEVTLEPTTSELVPFTIMVPEDASVGEHNGCILIQEKKEATGVQGGVQLSVRTGLRVALTIPGEIKRKLEIVDFTVTPREGGGFLFSSKVKNEGNVSIDADAQIVTRYFFGTELARHGGQFPVLAGETSDWNFELSPTLWGGWYSTTFTVEYDESDEAGVGVRSGEALTRIEALPVMFFIMPAPLGLAIETAILLVISIIFVVLVRGIRRKRWIRKKWKARKVLKGEDIDSLSVKYGVSWKLLVKVNALKPPYTLRSGQKIKVPPRKKKMPPRKKKK